MKGEQDTQLATAREGAGAHTVVRCAVCGHLGAGPCGHCAGRAQDLDGHRALVRGRGVWLLDVGRGLAVVARAPQQLLHHRAFVGLLSLPIAANVAATLTLGALVVVVWTPLVQVFASPWPVLDGFRQARQDSAPMLLLLATVWLLWPVWFEVVAGAAVDAIAAATEVAVAGAGMGKPARSSPSRWVERLHRRARLLALEVLLLPLVWLLALVPVVGLPLVFVGTAWLAAGVWTELPAERRAVPHAVHVADLRRNWARALGYGLGAQACVVVPLLNVLLLAPALAVAASAMHFEWDKGTAVQKK